MIRDPGAHNVRLCYLPLQGRTTAGLKESVEREDSKQSFLQNVQNKMDSTISSIGIFLKPR